MHPALVPGSLIRDHLLCIVLSTQELGYQPIKQCVGTVIAQSAVMVKKVTEITASLSYPVSIPIEPNSPLIYTDLNCD